MTITYDVLGLTIHGTPQPPDPLLCMDPPNPGYSCNVICSLEDPLSADIWWLATGGRVGGTHPTEMLSCFALGRKKQKA